MALAAAGVVAPPTARFALAETPLPPIDPPAVTAKAIYVYDATAGIPLYAKNPDDHLAIGSVVKLMTALVVVHYVSDLDGSMVTIQASDILTAEEKAAGYTNMDLVDGDVLSVHHLLWGLMLPSVNDAARALARYVGGTIAGTESAGAARDAFVTEMNAYGKSLGLDHSRFTVPDGVDTSAAYSSAQDVSILMQHCVENEDLAYIMNQPAYQFYSDGPKATQYAKQTTNKLLGKDGIIAGKTGTTESAGANVALARRVNNGSNLIIIVVLGAEHSYTDIDPATGQVVDKRWDDVNAIDAAMDDQFTWAAPDADDVLPGLSDEMAVWGVALKNPPAIPVPQNLPDAALGYQLLLSPPTTGSDAAGALLLYFGTTEMGSIPIFKD